MQDPVPTGARTAVFFKNGAEVGRTQVRVQAGRVNKVRF